MQLYAFDIQGKLTSARQATRQTDYRCLECGQAVRLRGGPHRQRHFYHQEPHPFCRQHQKGEVHLQLQSHFFQLLPEGDCQLEQHFPSIGRIADVAWVSEHIVFEIQCSPISAEEILSRNRDYRSIGWEVVWILHDQRYNQYRLSSAEIALKNSPHYFTNMNGQGVGIIYDQFDLCDQGIRLHRLAPLRLDIRERIRNSGFEGIALSLTLLKERKEWPLFFKGDLIFSFFENSEGEYLQQAKKFEKFFDSSSFKWSHLPFLIWKKGIVIPYQIFFRFLLERMCR